MRTALEIVGADDVIALIACDNDGSRDMNLDALSKHAARMGKLGCLRWTYMRNSASANELLPYAFDHQQCYQWLLSVA